MPKNHNNERVSQQFQKLSACKQIVFMSLQQTTVEPNQ